MNRLTNLLGRTITLAAVALASTVVHAQAGSDYPAKPIRIILPYGAGTAVDAAARMIEQRMSASWGQQVIVDNRPGANGVIATQAAAKSPPDGYTVVLGAHATMAINPHVYSKIPYDPVKDFVPIGGIFTAPYILVANSAVKANSVGELIELAKRQPGTLTYASYGVGSGSHIAAELFASIAKVKLQHVPYKTGSMTDVIGGQVSLSFEPVAVAAPHIRAGKVKALGVTGSARVAALPDIPAIGESLPGYESTSWSALFAPAGTPSEHVAKLSRELARIVALPEVRKSFLDIGLTSWPTTGAELGATLQADLTKYKALVEATGIKLD